MNKNELFDAIDEVAKQIYDNARNPKPLVYFYSPTEIKWLKEFGWLIEDENKK